jgi:hypothetical protein
MATLYKRPTLIKSQDRTDKEYCKKKRPIKEQPNE